MTVEFDPDKSRINKTKHGIDFIEAQALWDDDNLIEIPAKNDRRITLYGYRDDIGQVLIWCYHLQKRSKKNHISPAISPGGGINL